MPQFCLDNGIKNPLFVVLNERRADFIWEIHAQFTFDKRITPTFAVLNTKDFSVDFNVSYTLPSLNVKNIFNLNVNQFDGVILLTLGRLNLQISNAIYLDQLSNFFIARTYAEIPLLHFAKSHSGLKIFTVNTPFLYPFKDTNADEINNIKYTVIQDICSTIEQSGENDKIKTPFDFLGYSNKDVLKMIKLSDSKTNSDGSTILEDNEDKFVNVVNGKRITENQPHDFKNTIHFIGTCVYLYFGIGAPYYKTVESYLQNFLNERNLPYRVENESQFFASRYQDIFYNLNHLNLKSGDIIFICLQNLMTQHLPAIDLSNVFKGYRNLDKIFVDRSGHINEIGYKILAKEYFKFLVANNFFQNTEFNYPAPPPPPHRY